MFLTLLKRKLRKPNQCRWINEDIGIFSKRSRVADPQLFYADPDPVPVFLISRPP
jgi:hypothetical protein